MNAITTKRTQSENKNFNHLMAQLDNDLNGSDTTGSNQNMISTTKLTP